MPTIERVLALESELAEVKEKLRRRNNNNIERLDAYNKAHPECKQIRNKRYVDKDRDAFNARRRERRRLAAEKKKAEAMGATGVKEAPATGILPGVDKSAAVVCPSENRTPE